MSDCEILYIHRTHDECLIIPTNNPFLMRLGKMILPLVVLLFMLKVVISKNINEDIIGNFDNIEYKNRKDFYIHIFQFITTKISKIFKIKKDDRSYTEIFINLIIIWLIFGQGSAGITSILYTKSDKKFIESIKNQDVDELSIYMPRFMFDELIAVPIRYLMWNDFYQYMKNKCGMNNRSLFTELNNIDYYYVLFRGFSWGLNISISITFAASYIAMINYYFMEWSPLVFTTIWLQNLTINCESKYLITLVIRLVWEIIQVQLANLVLANPKQFMENVKSMISFKRSDNFVELH